MRHGWRGAGRKVVDRLALTLALFFRPSRFTFRYSSFDASGIVLPSGVSIERASRFSM